MKKMYLLGAMLTGALLFAPTAASAADIYKYLLPDQSVLYSEKPADDGKLLDVIKVPPLTQQQISNQQTAQRELPQQIARADRLTALRGAAQARTEFEYRIASQALACTERSLANSQEPGPGERTAIGGGYSRLNANYWERQRLLREKEIRLREQLEQAEAELLTLQ